LFLAITYYVVVFSIIVQGLTIGKLTSFQRAPVVQNRTRK
jgi:monovalent cation:H+ antiporter, CPA1 family